MLHILMSLMLLAVAALLAAGLAVFAYQRRSAAGAWPLAMSMVGVFIWNVTYLLSFLPEDIGIRISIANCRYSGITIAVLSMYFISYQVSRQKAEIPAGHLKWLLIFPAVEQIVIWTNPWHHQFYERTYIDTANPMILILDEGPAFWPFAFYFYGIIAVSVFLLAKTAIQKNGIFRRQATILALTGTIPFISNVIFIFMLPSDSLDLTPISFLVIGVLNAYNIFHFQMFDVVPVARDELFVAIRDIIIVLDDRMRICDINRSGLYLIEQMGGSSKQVVGKSARDIFSEWGKPVYDVAGHEENVPLRINHDGFSRCFIMDRVRLSHRKIAQGGYLVILKDVTELERARADAHKAQQEAERASAVKSSFLATVSHEIRTPLNIILGISDVLYHEEDDNHKRQHVGMIKESSETLLALINEILDYSKIEAGHIDFESIAFSPRQLADFIRTAMAHRTEQKGIQYTVEVSDRVPETCISDPLRIKQILLNIVSNAVKFTDDGSVYVRFDADPLQNILHLSVTDTGIGIPEDRIGSIFDSFQQVDNSISRRYGGTGLGLSIVKQIVVAFRGDIAVKSEVGQGSVFDISLPYSPSRDEPFAAHTDVSVAAQPPALPQDVTFLEGKNILIVDDNAINRQMLQVFFKKMKVNLFEASSGDEAVLQAQKHVMHVVLMDIQMPGMDGYTACRQIRRDFDGMSQDALILAVTADETEEARRKSQGAGMDGLISKPVKKSILFETLISCLSERENNT